MATPPDLTLTLSYPTSLQATPYGPLPVTPANTQVVGWTTTPYLPRTPINPGYVPVSR